MQERIFSSKLCDLYAQSVVNHELFLHMSPDASSLRIVVFSSDQGLLYPLSLTSHLCRLQEVFYYIDSGAGLDATRRQSLNSKVQSLLEEESNLC
jgi:hypothetical protein